MKLNVYEVVLPKSMPKLFLPRILFVCLACCCHIASAQADVVIIVHPSNASVLDKAYIKNLYMGRTKVFSNGEKAVPIELDTGKTRSEFLDKVIGKTEGELQSYWSRMLFTGKGQPPKVVEEELEVRKLVANNPNLIGFIDSGNVDDSVKVVRLP